MPNRVVIMSEQEANWLTNVLKARMNADHQVIADIDASNPMGEQTLRALRVQSVETATALLRKVSGDQSV